MLIVSYDRSGGETSRIDATGQIATASKIWFFDEYDSKDKRSTAEDKLFQQLDQRRKEAVRACGVLALM